MTPTPARATRREWIGLAVIALPCLVYAMDLTVLNLALPAIGADLQPSASQLLWIVDIYGFFVAGFLITMGTLGDRFGRRRLLMIGAAAFAVASLVAAFSRSAEMLIVMRAVLGVAGAIVAPSTMSLIRNMFHDERERQFAIGVWIASFSLGGAIGPLVGGILLQFFGWGAVFLAAVPVMLMLLLLGPVLLPEYRDPAASGRIDGASVGLSLAAVLLSIGGLKRLAEHGPGALAFAALAAGLLLAVVFVRRQRHLAEPLLDLALFRNRRFSGAIGTYALSCIGMFGIYIFITQYLQLVLGLSPLKAGLATVPWSLGFMVGSLLAPRLTRHWPAGTVVVLGLAATTAGFVLLAFSDGAGRLPLLVFSTVVMSLGLSPVFTVVNELILTAAPPERAGAASALSETSAEFSGALGIAAFGSLGTALYQQGLSASLPGPLPPELMRTALATLAGALAVAQELPAAAGTALAAAARTVYTEVLQATALLAAAVTALAAGVSARILRPHAGP